MSKSRDIANSAATINFIDGLTSGAQGQINDKATLDGSPTFTGTVTATSFSGDGSALTGVDSLPSQTGNAGKFLTTNGTASTWDAVDVSSEITGTLPVANGGTGSTSLTVNNVILGNGTGAVQAVAPSTSGNVLTSNGSTWVSQAVPVTLIGETDTGSPFSTFLGYNAGVNTTGLFNTAVGNQALEANTTGGNNTALGYQAGNSITTGTNNTVIGYDADASSATVSNEITLGNTTAGTLRIPPIQSGASAGDVMTFDGSKIALASISAGNASVYTANGASVPVGNAFMLITATTIPSGWTYSGGVYTVPSTQVWMGIFDAMTQSGAWRQGFAFTNSTGSMYRNFATNQNSFNFGSNVSSYLPIYFIRLK